MASRVPQPRSYIQEQWSVNLAAESGMGRWLYYANISKSFVINPVLIHSEVRYLL